MIQLVTDVFDVKNDPDQLNVNEDIIKHLQLIHPATMSEYADENGPAVWLLLIPTTTELMDQFISCKINEQQLYALTPVDTEYQAIYLCSAMALPEYRGKGIAKRLALEAIESIRKDHPIQTLFVWPFTKQGDELAEKLAQQIGLPLLKRSC